MRLSAGCLFVLSLWAASVSAQTCDYPWTPTHDESKLFEAGFYRHPYSQIIEVLGVVNGRVYVRNERGRSCVSPPVVTELVWSRGKVWRYADCVFASVLNPQQEWGRLPDGCYVPSTVAIVTPDGTEVR